MVGLQYITALMPFVHTLLSQCQLKVRVSETHAGNACCFETTAATERQYVSVGSN